MATSRLKLFDRWKVGDTINYSYGVTSSPKLAGELTGSNKGIYFTIPTSRVVVASRLTLTELSIKVRGVNGGYIVGNADNPVNIIDNSSYESVEISVNSFVGINVKFNLKTASTHPNNSPVIVELHTIRGSFS